jgi:hypothetical protein
MRPRQRHEIGQSPIGGHAPPSSSAHSSRIIGTQYRVRGCRHPRTWLQAFRPAAYDTKERKKSCRAGRWRSRARMRLR